MNLYIPSTVRWTQDGAEIVLTQKSGYPSDAHVQLELKTSKATEFTVSLRIPAWADQASIAVNGKRETAVQPGRFVRLQRQWKSGDRIDLELPLTPRLEQIDKAHPDTVALLAGPVVLFAITQSEPAVTRAQLLSAKRVGTENWTVDTARGPLKMLPFTAIGDQQYWTYLRVT